MALRPIGEQLFTPDGASGRAPSQMGFRGVLSSACCIRIQGPEAERKAKPLSPNTAAYLMLSRDCGDESVVATQCAGNRSCFREDLGIWVYQSQLVEADRELAFRVPISCRTTQPHPFHSSILFTVCEIKADNTLPVTVKQGKVRKGEYQIIVRYFNDLHEPERASVVRDGIEIVGLAHDGKIG